MTKNESISKAAFRELCKYVCYQLVPSGSEELDRETLNFAIYWQICNIFAEQILLENNSCSKTITYQQRLQDLLNVRLTDPFDALQIVNMNIEESVSSQYKDQTVFLYSKLECSTDLLINKVAA